MTPSMMMNVSGIIMAMSVIVSVFTFFRISKYIDNFEHPKASILLVYGMSSIGINVGLLGLVAGFIWFLVERAKV